MKVLFAALHKSAHGTLPPKANTAACPQPAEGDIRARKVNSGFDPNRK
jgi:hypothetical protein